MTLPLSALLAALTLGCTKQAVATDPDTSADGDDGGSDDTGEGVCEDDGDCEGWEICEDAACATGDRSESPEEAVALLWENPTGGIIQSDGDVDYFSFTAEGGEWIRITTQPLDDEELDTIVSLYDPSGKLHHQEDDFPTGSVSTYDTVLQAYLPDAGEWLVAVEDVNGQGEEDFEYIVQVEEIGGTTSESDSFSDPSSNVVADSDSTIWSVGVLLEEPGDVDYISLSLPWDDCPVEIYGAAYTGGTDADPTVELYLPDTTRLLRKESLGPEGFAQYFGVDGGQAVIAASDAALGGGDEHWFFVYVRIRAEGSWVRESESNDSEATASPLSGFEYYTASAGEYAYQSAWGVLGSASDEDWYEVEVPDDGYQLHVWGSAGRYGSTASPLVEVFDSGGSPLSGTAYASEDDTFGNLLNMGEVAAGTYYVRVTDGESSGEDAFYRVSPYITTFSYEL